MKTLTALLAVCATAVFSATLLTIATVDMAAAADEEKSAVRIGYVDVQKTLNESIAGRAAKDELQGIVQKTQEAINEKVAEKEKLQTELEKQAIVLSPEARREKTDMLEKMERDLQRMIADANTTVSKKQRDLEISILDEIKDIIDDIAKEKGYTLVIPAEMIIYSVEDAELTEEIIKRYDAQKEKDGSKEENKKTKSKKKDDGS